MNSQQSATGTLKTQALALLRNNRPAEAKILYTRICELDPGDADAWYMLGNVNGMLGRIDEAGACTRRAIAIRPEFAAAHCNLGSVLLSQGHAEEALVSYREALRCDPGYAEAHCNLGNVLQNMGHIEEAETSYREALRLKPDLITASYNLGNLLLEQEKLDEAQACYRQVLRLNPRSVEAHNNLGNVLMHLGWHEEALASYGEALRLNPGFSDGYCNRGTVFELQGRFDEALENYRQALRLNPEDIRAIAGEASVLARKGEYDAAYQRLRPVIEGETCDCAVALALAAFCRHVERCDEAIGMMERLLKQGKGAPGRYDRVSLHFALGRLYDSAGAYDEAFAHYRQGNALKTYGFDPEGHARYIEGLMQAYSQEFMSRAPRAALKTHRPVFIIGMPRSGTSLVEQILASHPGVYGAGELEDIGRITKELPVFLGAGQPYPQCLPALSEEKCNAQAQRYLDHLSALSGDALRVTDKFPRNFLHLGLIALLFPGARIIHCVRDPLDTCLSCYFQNFVGGNSYADDLEHLGNYYRQYLRLMRHWEETLTLPMLEVRYEQLVTEPERVSRALVGFCGLDWDERCLRFHENRRVVATASYDQVNKPLYTGSVGRWKHYERYLEPLKSALAGG